MDKNKSLVLILGAGNAKRMGFPKGLFIFQSKELIRWHIEMCDHLNLDYRVILNSENQKQYMGIISDRKILINHKVDEGPISSVKIGLEYGITNNFFEFYILPIDTFPLKFETIIKLQREKNDLTIPSFDNRLGHPPKLSQKMAILFLSELSHIKRLDYFFKQQEKKICLVDDAHILSNQNTTNVCSS